MDFEEYEDQPRHFVELRKQAHRLLINQKKFFQTNKFVCCLPLWQK